MFSVSPNVSQAEQRITLGRDMVSRNLMFNRKIFDSNNDSSKNSHH